ncbi:DUF974-domain-containing protein [Rickenella mellea]|uniref:DUF974-domain-containing protein n=1 Tax=Rickenella mellea TaxID=50990 RepID=A0A4Y7QJF9_9AGAM|nr:DUF974-domain-containing protein [Rickenella mellea]
MDGSAHPLSLKVMRVSRPSLAAAWQPFFSSSPSLSAHSTASVLSLQGSTPLEGHPKTLRDLTHASQMLTLPSSFGAIQLGETFSSCLCINNEAAVDIDAVSMKIEMQTAAVKTLLAEIGGPDHTLKAGDTIESVVSHEMKELGQHVLACTVFYRLPTGARPHPHPTGEVPEDPSIQTFRKFYKFVVTNPLSVKTKVHTSRSPTALLSASERDKIFLEVHIQNQTQEPMWFERMRLEPSDGWRAEDGNVLDGENIFSGTNALMNPQDMRQYIYVLTPVPAVKPSFPVPPTPGTVIPLGRLDISWRSSLGEPGRLLTSVLSRRIPLIPAPPPPPVPMSAIPPYLQKSNAPQPPRPRSPALSQPPTRIGTPPPPLPPVPRSPAPYKRASAPPTRQQSPGPDPARIGSPTPGAAPGTHGRADVEVDLVVNDVPYGSTRIQEPFILACTLNVSATVPTLTKSSRRSRHLNLAVQHVQPRTIRPTQPETAVAGPHGDLHSPLVPSSGFSTPSPGTAARGVLMHAALTDRLIVASPRGSLEEPVAQTDTNLDSESVGVRLPPPFTDGKSHDEAKVVYSGSSAMILPPFHLSRSATVLSEGGDAAISPLRAEAKHQFTLSYLPLKRGFARVGGLRVLLVDDREVDEEYHEGDANSPTEQSGHVVEARILKEWDVVAEVWIQ